MWHNEKCINSSRSSDRSQQLTEIRIKPTKMSNQILLPLEAFAHNYQNNMASEYSNNCTKDDLRSHQLSMDKDAFHSQEQSNSSSSGVGSGSESGTSDYQRSTPSPRDDPFQDQSIIFKEKAKPTNAKDDLGFVDDLNVDDNNRNVLSQASTNSHAVTPKKVKTKIGFSPRSFYKSSSSHGDKINKLINDANNSFSIKRNRSKRDLNQKLNENETRCKKYKKRSSDCNSNKNYNMVSKVVPTSKKNKCISPIVTEKISKNASNYSFSEREIKGCDPLRRDNVSNSPQSSLIVPNSVQNNQNAHPHSAKINVPEKQIRDKEFHNDLKKPSKRRASEADLISVRQNNKHPKLRAHKRSKSSSSRRRNDMKHILTNYQNRLIQQRHQDHQAHSHTSASPNKSPLCNIIRPAKLTNVTPTKLPPSPSNVPIQVQQTIVKSNRQLIMLPPNMNRSNAIPTQINTTYNKQMIIVPAPNNMGSQLPTFYHHQSEVRTTSFTSIVPTASMEAPKQSSVYSKNNPFLPATNVKSSFLFGNNDDFETAEDADDVEFDDEVILAMGSESSSDESEDEVDDHIIYSPIDDDEVTFDDDKNNATLSSNSMICNDDNAHPTNKHHNSSSRHDGKRESTSNMSFNETNTKTENELNSIEKLPVSNCQIIDIKDAYLSSNSNDSLANLKQDVNENDHKSISKDSNQKIRFPATQGPNNMIECKWTDCQMSFTTYGRLSDHLKV